MRTKDKFITGGFITAATVAVLVALFGGSTKPPQQDNEPLREAPAVITAPANYTECVNADGETFETETTLSCAIQGKTFTQEKNIPQTPGEEAGKQLGETYNTIKETSKDFWKGFSEETTVDETAKDAMEGLTNMIEEYKKSKEEIDVR